MTNFCYSSTVKGSPKIKLLYTTGYTQKTFLFIAILASTSFYGNKTNKSKN